MPTSLKSVHEKLQKIAETSSILGKISFLKEGIKGDPVFRQVLRLAYNQTYSYNVSQFPPFNPIGFSERGFEHVLPILKTLVQSNGASNQLKESLFQAAAIDKETYEVVRNICNSDLKCGVAARLINKAVPNTVKIISYMRCATSKHIDRINFEPMAIAQCKADGTFANMFVDENYKIEFLSRDMQEIKFLQHLKAQIRVQKSKLKFGGKRGMLDDQAKLHNDRVYNGELRVFEEDGSIMPRRKGNGIINQCIQGTVDPKIAKRIFYTAWDSIKTVDFWNGETEEPYRSRWYYVTALAHKINNSNVLRSIEFEYVSSLDEAFAFFRKMRSNGEEGAVIKNLDGKWEDNQSGSKDCIKIKHSFECDLIVVGWNPGRKGTKYEHVVGAIVCESSCGKLRVTVSGLLDKEREWDWDLMISKRAVVTVEAESVSTAKNKELYSLYTPSFIEPRIDKKVANSLEEIIEIANESKKTRRRKA